MERTDLACSYHERGYNCCQSVLAAFTDLTGLDEAQSVNLGGGFGRGAGTGELCGAVTGAVMVLGLLAPGDKRRASELAKEFQRRFTARFGALRCEDLLPRRFTPDDTTPAAKRLGLTGHCRIMIVTAVELVEDMLG